VGLFSSGEDDVLVLIDSALVNLGVLVLIGAMLKLPMSLIVVVLMASLVKPTCSFIVLVLINSALVNLTWSFSVHSHRVLVLMSALLKLPLSFLVVVLVACLVKHNWSLIVLLLIDSALVNLTWSFSVLSHSVLVLMVALLKLPLSFVVVVFIGRSRSPSPLMS
jgi:hypothetical protein